MERNRDQTSLMHMYIHIHVYMLSAKYGFGLSADFVAQTPDPCSAQQIRAQYHAFALRLSFHLATVV